ncbi:MAG: hypothetical protein HYV28_13600 [Ignavibacteriales bacterium]|nr:hypothetical protein [Ignavibacteriales bacterium]
MQGIKKVIEENYGDTAESIMQKIFKSAKEFSKSKKWEDDATVLVIKRQGA